MKSGEESVTIEQHQCVSKLKKKQHANKLNPPIIIVGAVAMSYDCVLLTGLAANVIYFNYAQTTQHL